MTFLVFLSTLILASLAHAIVALKNGARIKRTHWLAAPIVAGIPLVTIWLLYGKLP